jgi:hypothetical protein
MVVGGVAVAVRGAARFTRDIDAAAILGAGQVPALLHRLGPRWRAAVARPGAFARVHGVLPLVGPGRTPVDILLAGNPLECAAVERATRATFLGVRVRVARIEDLVVAKLVAGRTQDLEDVRRLLAVPGRSAVRRRVDARVRSFAAEAGMAEVLEVWLALFPPPRPRRRPAARGAAGSRHRRMR